MPNFILTRSSVILCPHGGMVMHMPYGVSAELINGEPPLMLSDIYTVAGCPQVASGPGMACMSVQWTSHSVTKLINGIPVLTHTSVGLCQSIGGVIQGTAIIASFQTRVMD
jgi:hypothetical protein